MSTSKRSNALLIMVGLGLLSLVLYTVVTSWEFALLLMGSLVFHEYGHIWAMKRSGMKTKGIYLIPFIGGAAVTTDKVPSLGAMVYIALMGPLWGFALAAVTFLGYLLTGWPVLAGAALWMAAVNLFNLLPIPPLDGGHVMRSVAYSTPRVMGAVCMGIGALLGGFLALKTGWWIFWIVAFFAWMELSDFLWNRPERQTLLAFLSWRREILEEAALTKRGKLHLSLVLQTLRGVKLSEAELSIPPDPELLSATRKVEDKLREPPTLSTREICFSIGGYLLLTGLLMLLLAYAASVPGAWESIENLIRK